jgi:hypothetical protein
MATAKISRHLQRASSKNVLVQPVPPMKKNSTSRSPLRKLQTLTCLALLCATPISVKATTITVTNTDDSGPGSLRQALADANDGDTITFAVTDTIRLTSGELLVDKSITISGPGAASIAVDGNTQSRVFHIGPGKTDSISGLTIINGNVAFENGGGILNDHAMLTMDSCAVQYSSAQYDYGGGVYNDGSGSNATLTILNSTFSGNYASYAGGGIYNDASNGGSGTVSLMNSTIDSNAAGYYNPPFGAGEGGGIYNGGGTLMITSSVVSNNDAGVSEPFPVGFGGGISNYGTLTITDSTINSNLCYLAGGGIYNGGTLTITGSTVSGNGATGQHDGKPFGHGGGILGVVTFTNSTLSGNYVNLSTGGLEGGGTITNSTISGNNGGGISVNGTLEIGNTVLNASASDPNISNNGGTVTSHGYNVSSDDGGGYLTGPGDQINTDPMLGPLQDNGGSTLTHALLPGSPAIDEGDPSFTPPPWYDQRGPNFWRVRNNRVDIGSFEVQNGPALTPTPTPRPGPTPRLRPTPPPRPTPR